MTDSKKIATALIIDRSGSMDSIRSDAQGMINVFIEGRQRQAREDGLSVLVKLSQFDGNYDQVYPSTPAVEVPAFTLVPRGSTALLDAMGRGITELGAELAALPEEERPGKVIVAIVTDGQENSSKEWTYEQVAALVKQQTEVYGWDITYLGANQDAIAVAAKVGIAAGSALSWGTSGVEMRETGAVMDSYVVASASAGPGLRTSYSDEDRKRSKSS